ncbi:MAG: DUF3990 domain-containing protein [Roseburia sp.]|nr:DUF3990 domain-containing protein [Roseburia sp.]
MEKVILYHGSNVEVRNPQIINAIKDWILVQDFMLRLI